MKRFLFALLLLSSTWGFSQVSITGTVADLGGSAVSGTVTAKFDLANCGTAWARIAGVNMLMPYSKTFTASAGTFSGTLRGNSVIDCGGTQNTYYKVTRYINGVQVGVPLNYILPDTGTWDMDSATPVNPIPSAPAVFQAMRYRGNWSSVVAYNPQDVVTYSGNQYIGLIANTNVAPNSDGTKWQLLALQGPAGTLAPPASNLSAVSLTPTPQDGTIYKILDNQRGYYQYDSAQARVRPVSTEINVQDFGARGDGGYYPQTSTTSGSAVITVVFNTLGRMPIVGDTMVVSGAGVAGADLQCTLSAVNTGGHTATCGGGVTAGATLSNRGARWGASVDDTAAIQSAITYCQSLPYGCTLRFPSGVYFVSTLNIPAVPGASNGSIVLQGVGRTSSWLVGIGAAQSAIISAPASSVPLEVARLGFQSYDYINKQSTGIYIQGGTEHYLHNLFMNQVYDGIRMSNTWLNLIEFNRIYVFYGQGVNFDSSTGPVIQTQVRSMELSGAVNGWAIKNTSAGAGGSNYNAYEDISCEGQIYLGCIYTKNDSYSVISHLRTEIQAANTIQDGTYRQIYLDGSSYATVSTSILNAPSPATYAVTDNGAQNTWFKNIWTGPGSSGNIECLNCTGMVQIAENTPRSTIAGAGAANALRVASGSIFDTATIALYKNTDSVNARKADTLVLPGVSGGSNYNSVSFAATVTNDTPSAGSGASFNRGDFIGNSSAGNATINSHGGWACFSQPCSWNGSTWTGNWAFYLVSQSRFVDGTAAPGASAWRKGDFVRNTNPNAGDPLGWRNNVAGSPGTWETVYPGAPLYNTSGTVQNSPHQVIGSGALTSATPSTLAVTLTGAAVFTSNTSYKCALTNETTQANPVKITYTSGSAFTITGPNTVTDTIGFVCTGN